MEAQRPVLVWVGPKHFQVDGDGTVWRVYTRRRWQEFSRIRAPDLVSYHERRPVYSRREIAVARAAAEAWLRPKRVKQQVTRIALATKDALRACWPGHRFEIGPVDGVFGRHLAVEINRGGWRWKYELREDDLVVDRTLLSTVIADAADTAWQDYYSTGY